MNSNSEGIVVYCKKGNVIFSSSGDLIETPPNVRKHKTNKFTIHQEFIDMKQYCIGDDFWDSMLSKFSKNIFPKNFKYLNNILYFKISAKKHRCDLYIDKEEIETSFKNLKDFLKTKGFLSPLEKEENNKLLEAMAEDEEEKDLNNWKNINNKEYYLTEFMIELKDKYNLNKKEYGNLESTVKIGICSDFFNSDNIILENSKIIDIEILIWDKEERKFSIDTENIKFKKKNEKKNQNKLYTSYTIETSGDNVTVFYSEINKIEIQKKFTKFLENFY